VRLLRRLDGTGRGRLVVALWTALALAVVGGAVVFAGPDKVPLSGFRKAGHWVFDNTLGAAFHIDGPTKNVDGKVTGFAGAGHAAALTVQGPARGYVLRPGSIDVFDTPSLTVDTNIPMNISEEPVGLEVTGGPYLVYRQTGTAVRLDVPPVVIQLGGPVGDPVTTEDGTVWLQRTDTGAMCRIKPGVGGIQCGSRAPAGHHGQLAVISGMPAFVDVTAATVQAIRGDGPSLGTAVPLPTQIPAGAKLGNADVEGRLPVVDGGHSAMLLVDLRQFLGHGSGGDVPPVQVRLAAGEYSQIAVGAGTVALLNRTTSEVLVFDGQGHPKGSAPVPGGSQDVKITRGEDQRLYVDNAAGTHTLVVDHDGSVTSVPLGGANLPSANNPLPTPPAAPPKAPTVKNPPPNQPVKKAAPGAPGRVTGQPGNAQARITWDAAAPNGAAITGYSVTWRSPDGASGAVQVAGNQLTAVATGLRNGTGYVATVVAHNSVGDGPPGPSAPFTPSSEVPGAPGAVKADASRGDGTVAVSWSAADGQGHTIAHYDVTAKGSDGSTAQVAQTSGTSATVTGLGLGVSYTFTVTATNDLGTTGQPSAPSNATTPFQPAGAPTGVTVAVRDGGATITWSAPDLRGGTLQHYVVDATGQPARTVDSGPVSFDGLTNGTTYTFSVHAVTRGAGGGPDHDGAAASSRGTPGRTASADVVGATLSGDRQVTVRLSLNLYNSGAATCRLIFNGAQRWSGGCADSITVGGLDYGTTYDIYASLVNAYGTGPTGSHGSVTTNAPPPPPPSVSVGRGGHYSGSACTSASCAYVTVTLNNFAAGTRYTVTCVTSGPSGGSGDYYTYSVTTNGAGASTSSTCFYGYPGQSVWARVNGTESNHFVW
jgi:hypothetical protein